MVAGVQIESHTPPCSYEGRRKSLFNPSLTPGDFFSKLVLSLWDISQPTAPPRLKRLREMNRQK